jgi:class 3 adenylate cyclase
MRCQSCSTENPKGAKFCIQCATPFKRACQKCAFENPPEARFCAQCATSLSGEAAQPSKAATDPTASGIRVAVDNSEPQAIEGERKTVTALFADIKGSTELEQDLDPEEARAIIDPALKLMIDAARRYDGYIVQSTGDGIFALFGAPVAHEDHPQRALYAALRMQEELKRYSARLREAGNLPLEARVGVNTGEVVVRSIKTGEGHTEYTPIGHTTNLASRMQALAPTGSIAISEQTRKFVEGYFALKPLGPTRVKGVSEPVNVYEVTGLGPLRTRLQRSAGRGFTKFVGRQPEIDAIARAAELAKSGRGQIVAAVAQPGVGKSRLYYEFKAKNQLGWMVLETFSVSHGKASPYAPVIALLSGYFDFDEGDDARRRREKVIGRIVAFDRSLEDTLPYVFALLDIADSGDAVTQLDGQIRSRRALDAIKRILIREAQNQPLMLIFEDLHEIDEGSQALLNLLIESIGASRILLLVNYRPEYKHEWGNRASYTQLRLEPLARESAAEMLSAMLGDAPEVAPLKAQIIDKTGGTPFFIEETIQSLLEDGTLVRNGQIKVARAVGELRVPATVQALLASRIDRLPAAEKQLLQTLAVIGNRFPIGLVARVEARTEEAILPILSDLQEREFIIEEFDAGEIEYRFKHALTHDVAYASLLAERRRVLHERAGAAMETIYAARVDEHLGELAFHYALSGDAEKAIEYRLRACRQCSQRGTFSEGGIHYETGLQLLDKIADPFRRAELELDLIVAGGSGVWIGTGAGSQLSADLSDRTIALARLPGLDWKKVQSALGVVSAIQLFVNARRNSQITDELMARAEERGEPMQIVSALASKYWAVSALGQFDVAGEAMDRMAELLEAMPNAAGDSTWESLRSSNHIMRGANLFWLGYPDRALELIDSGRKIAIECADKNSERLAFSGLVFQYTLRNEPENLRSAAEAEMAFTREIGDANHLPQSRFFLAASRAMAGALEESLPEMRRSIAEYRAVGNVWGVEYYLALFASFLGKAGKFDDALRTIEESISIITETGERLFEAEVLRLKGEILIAQDRSTFSQADKLFREAIDLSRVQHARMWELRSALSLARLLAKQDRRDDARAILADIYNWFTEGFDTADLKDAKALLDQLNG